MKNFSFKSILPHIIAVAVFLVATFIFCKPAFESGVVLKQSDLSSWHAMSHQSFQYKEQHGHFPLWVTSMFSGMPAYQVAIEGSWNPMALISKLPELWLPEPFNFFFLACIGFYFLTQCLRIRPWAGIMGAIMFAYCSFSPIIITAGHVTQMLALGYAPAVIGAAILIFRKKYLLGTVLTGYITALQIAQGHQQVSYYLFLILVIMSISYVFYFIKKRETTHLIKSLGLLLIGGILGILANAINLFPTYDYAKESKRGGQLVMNTENKSHEKIENGRTTGLSKDYAFQWSYGRAETWTLMFPGVMGYGTHVAVRDNEPYVFPSLDENSHVAKYVTETMNVPAEASNQILGQLSYSLYWGDQPFTNGPVYLGAIACMLFIMGMFYLNGKHKWWIFAATVFGIVLAWGSNFPAFNYFLFDHLPLYNKFRVPTMALIIPQITVPLLAALYVSKLATDNIADSEKWKKFKAGLIATGVVLLLGLGTYFITDFSNENKQRTAQFTALYNAKDPQIQQKLTGLKAKSDNSVFEWLLTSLGSAPEADRTARAVVSALRQDRASLYIKDYFRSLIFILLAVAALWLFVKNKIKGNVLFIALALLSFIDLYMIGTKYLNEKSFTSKDSYSNDEFPLSAADRQILADKDPNYRVLDLTGDTFQDAKPAYYHKSIGGYHAAKLGIYDDLTSNQFFDSTGRLNMGVINMLNAKYIIQAQGNEKVALTNPDALGNAWFVKAVVLADGPVAEMKGLTNLNTKDTAVVDKKFSAQVSGIAPADSTSTITMTKFDNDAISYQTNAKAKHLAVFSEIFYKDWAAYIDGNKVDIVKANYVLRALPVPAGAHTIEFKFEPKLFLLSNKISMVTGWLLFILLLAAIALELYQSKKEEA